MATDDGEKFSHSVMLFTTEEGLPMRFRLRPSEEKARVLPYVKHGGGKIKSGHQKSEDTLNLYIEGDVAIPDNAVKVQYIYDCVAQNRLLNIDDYRVPKDAPTVNVNSKPSSPSTSVISTTSTVKGRAKYTDKEDDAILSHIAKYPNSYKSNTIWQKMEMMKITNHPWQSMKDRFRKKLESRLPGYIKQYKAVVLEKYGFATSESSAEDEKGKKNKGSSSKNKKANKENVNNNNVEEELEEIDVDTNNDSLDELDETLLQNAGVENGQGTAISKAPQKEKLTFVESGKDKGTGDNTKHSLQQVQKQSHEKEETVQNKPTPRKTSSQHNQSQQEVGDQIQCSRVTMSSEASASQTKNTKDASKRKPAQSDGSDLDNIHNTISKKKCRGPKKLHPPVESEISDQMESNNHNSSQDTEAKDSGEDYHPSPVRQKARQAGVKRNSRKSSRRKMTVVESSSSGSEEDEPATHKTQRLDRAAIDKIIKDKQPSTEDEEKASKSESEISNDTETEMEVDDAVPQDQDDDDDVTEALVEDVEAVQDIMSKYSISAEAALYAVYINSGDIDAACCYIETGQSKTGHALWMKEDDSKLDSAKPEDIRNLVKKFGQKEVSARQEYLDS